MLLGETQGKDCGNTHSFSVSFSDVTSLLRFSMLRVSRTYTFALSLVGFLWCTVSSQLLPRSKLADQAVSLQVTIALLKNAMIKSSSDMFLVDGFPRALDQAEIFERDIMPCQMVRPLPTSCMQIQLIPCLAGIYLYWMI